MEPGSSEPGDTSLNTRLPYHLFDLQWSQVLANPETEAKRAARRKPANLQWSQVLANPETGGHLVTGDGATRAFNGARF